MYLSKVELYGFKSFADRTVFELDQGITAILGPNGCGKSNVVDAIKWVLGESSAKNLRGSNMQDVIFAGSEGRKPMGMAEVDLYFNNDDGILPIEYNEVCVTRRLYRSGESEYLINKQPCRKRDIRDLFLDTGVGMSAYSFIEQGRVEALLQAKPAERRLVIEEAAGISKYKQRRKETLARLDRTNQYLFRVNDVVEEIEKNVRRVSRQASSARRWQKLKNELDQLKTYHYTRSYYEQLERLVEIEKQKAEIQDLYSKEAAAQAEATQIIAKLTEEEMDLAQKVEESEKEFREIQEELGQVQINLATGSEKVDNLRGKSKNAAERAEHLQTIISQLEGEAGNANTEITTAKDELDKCSEILGGQDGRRGELQGELDSIELQIETLRKSLIEIAERRNEILSEEVRAESREAGLKERLQLLLERDGGIEEKEARISAELETLKTKLEEAGKNIESYNNQINAGKEEERNQHDLAAKVDVRIGEINNRISAKESRQSTLQDLENELEGAFAGVKAVLRAKKNGESRCSEVEGMIADLITVDQQYAVAIETVLGGQAQDLVVKTARGAQDSIRYLKDNRAGRATFLPLDRIRPRSPLREDLLNLNGVVGEAFDLVDFEDKHQPAMEYLLNGVLIAEDLTAARELAGSKAKGVRIVTLNGEVINPHGAMTGGEGNRQRAGLISRKAEKDALTEEITSLRESLQECLEMKEKYLAKSDALSNHNKEIEAKLAEALATGRAQQTELSVKESEALRIREDKANYDSEKSTLDNELSTLGANSVSFTEEKANLSAQEIENEKIINSLQERSRQARTELDALGESLAGIREKRATASSRVDELTRRIESLTSSLSERSYELNECNNIIDRSKVELENVNQQLAELKKREEELLHGRDSAHTGDVGDREKLKDIREQLDDCRNQEKSSQRRMTETTEALNNFKISENEINLRMENITERASIELEINDLRERAEQFAKENETVVSALTGEEIPAEIEDDEDKEHLAASDGTPVSCMTGEQLSSYVRDIEIKIERLGPVNMCAIDELAELEARAEFLKAEQDDISDAANNLVSVIDKLNNECYNRFEQTFEAVRENFQEMFTYLFGGGKADLILEQPEEGQDKLDCGIDIIARPPGKEPKSISLLSGGEKALCAVGLLFAIFRSKPSPFCILDEVDGPLDESNIDRFMNAVRNFTDETQFILISHSKRTMSKTDTIYGVTQQQPGVSTKYSLRFRDASQRTVTSEVDNEEIQELQKA